MEKSLPATEITALLGRGTSFEGKLHFEGRVRIDGRFRGVIRSPDVLIVGDGANVEAEVDVATVIVRGGVLRGNVRAARAIELHVPAQVTGDLHAPEIFMDKGVQFSGNCTMAPLEPEDVPPAGPPLASGGLSADGDPSPGSPQTPGPHDG